MRCDKLKLRPVIEQMVNDAARHWKQNGDLHQARFTLGQAGSWFEGLPLPKDADFSTSYSRGTLSEWKQRLFIGERGDDWEAEFVSPKKGGGTSHPLLHD